MAFHDNLRRCREVKSLSPDQAAAAIGVSLRQYTSWERGVGEPSLRALQKLAAAFGVSTDALLRGINDPPPLPPAPVGRIEDHEAFLAAIRESPNENGPRLVYADWLEDNGDPQAAEFIRVRCLADSKPADDSGVLIDHLSWSDLVRVSWERVAPELAARVAAHRRAEELYSANHERWPMLRWFGRTEVVYADDLVRLRQKLEDLRQAPFTGLNLTLRSTAEVEELLACAVLLRLSRLVLNLESSGGFDGAEVAEVVARLGKSGQLTRLTTFRLRAGTVEGADLEPIVRSLAETDGWGDLHELAIQIQVPYHPWRGLAPNQIERLGRAPHLRKLKELWTAVLPGRAGPAALAKAFPALELLSLDGLSGDGALALASAGMAALRDLDVGFHTEDRGRVAEIRAGVAALLVAPSLPRLSGFRVVSVSGLGGLGNLLRRGPHREPTLRYLALLNVELGPKDGAGIAACPALRGLMGLNLGSNAIESEGAVALAAGDWPRLVYLDLSSCKIGEAGARALAGAARMPELQWLQLSCNEFGPEGCKAFIPGQFPHLRRLAIVNCGETPGIKGVLRKRFGPTFNRW
jgi:uncharacterized protein (TIGR02996 family)